MVGSTDFIEPLAAGFLGGFLAIWGIAYAIDVFFWVKKGWRKKPFPSPFAVLSQWDTGIGC